MPQPTVNSSTVIQFRGVCYRYQQHQVLTNISLSIGQGEMLVLLGRSGSGKTTVLKSINHLLKPSQGDILVEDIPTTQWAPIQLRRRIGYVIQETGLFPHFTVERNIGLVPSLEGWARDRIITRVRELLNLVGLDPQRFAKSYPHELSGGQRQRVGVARALAADPPILLMDEPFGALDLLTRLDLQRELKQLQQQLGKTIIFVTHDIQEAFSLADRIGLMAEGKLVELGSKTEFLRSQNPEALTFIECFHSLKNSLAQQ